MESKGFVRMTSRATVVAGSASSAEHLRLPDSECPKLLLPAFLLPIRDAIIRLAVLQLSAVCQVAAVHHAAGGGGGEREGEAWADGREGRQSKALQLSSCLPSGGRAPCCGLGAEERWNERGQER